MWGVSAQKGRSRLRAGRGGEGPRPGPTGEGAEARGSFFVTQQWIPTLGQLNLVPVPAVLHAPPFFWQEVEGRSGGNVSSHQG